METYGLEIYGIPLAFVFFFYMYNKKKRETVALTQLKDNIEAGLTEPATLHPLIDPNKCMGAGSCIPVCPEDAIGMIKGKAVFIDPTVCIGHGACMTSCPHGAITLVYGTSKRGMDIPKVNPNFETNIPGIFIAGELGGMGLIRKAATQGAQAMESISKLKGSNNPLDVVIVGAGPAGLGACLGAIENKMRYVVVEQEEALGGAIFQYPRNKIVMTAPIKLPIVGEVKMSVVSKEELLEFWHGIIKKTGMKINYHERLEAITKADKGFIVKTTKNSYETRAVLLSLGRRGTPRKLGAPGEDLPKVVYRLIDPEQYRNMHVLVVGGGDSALEAANTIAMEPGTTVSISYRSDAFGRGKAKNREQLNALEKQGQLKVMLKSTVKQITPESVKIDYNGQVVEIPNDAIIVCAGGILPTPFLKELGIMVETKHGSE